MGGFPSGQRGQTVNLLSTTSVVRIHHLPPRDRVSKDALFLFWAENTSPYQGKLEKPCQPVPALSVAARHLSRRETTPQSLRDSSPRGRQPLSHFVTAPLSGEPNQPPLKGEGDRASGGGVNSLSLCLRHSYALFYMIFPRKKTPDGRKSDRGYISQQNVLAMMVATCSRVLFVCGESRTLCPLGMPVMTPLAIAQFIAGCAQSETCLASA